MDLTHALGPCQDFTRETWHTVGPNTQTALTLRPSWGSLRAGAVLPLTSTPPPRIRVTVTGQLFLGLPQVLSFLPGQHWGGARGEFPLRKVGVGAACQPSFRSSRAPACWGPRPGPGASACARLRVLSGLRGRRAHGQTDGPTDWRPEGQTR